MLEVCLAPKDRVCVGCQAIPCFVHDAFEVNKATSHKSLIRPLTSIMMYRADRYTIATEIARWKIPCELRSPINPKNSMTIERAKIT